MISLINVPVPVPFVVWLSAIVGSFVRPQHTPLVITSASPSEVTFPPDNADKEVIDVIGAVVTTGKLSVLNEISDPYEVPTGVYGISPDMVNSAGSQT